MQAIHKKTAQGMHELGTQLGMWSWNLINTVAAEVGCHPMSHFSGENARLI